MQYPAGWQVGTDPQTGRLDAISMSGVRFSILPFFIAGKTIDSSQAPQFLTALLKSLVPAETWSKPTVASANTVESSFSSEKENAAAALVLFPSASGTGGKLCGVRVPKGAQVPAATIAQMMNSFHYSPGAGSGRSINGAMSAPASMSAPPSMPGQPMPGASGMPPTAFVGFRRWVDPSV